MNNMIGYGSSFAGESYQAYLVLLTTWQFVLEANRWSSRRWFFAVSRPKVSCKR